MRQPNPEDRLYRLPRPEPARDPATEPRYMVISSGSIIGWTNLEFAFPHDRRAAGIFHPSPAFARVEPTFALYQPTERCDREQFERFLCERDQLSLQLIDGASKKLDAKVETVQEGDDGRHTIHVRVNDPTFFPEGEQPTR